MPRLRRLLTAALTAGLALPAATASAAVAQEPAPVAQESAPVAPRPAAAAQQSGPAALRSDAAASGSVLHDGFESPRVAGQSRRLPAGSRLGPWTVTAGNVDLSTTGLWQTTEGRQNLDLDGTVNGAVAATIATRPLTTYRVTFDLAGNPAAAPLVKTGEVRVDGKVVQRFAFDTKLTSLSRMGFTTRTVYVFALSNRMRLEFAGTTRPAGYGPVIDDVRVDSCLIIVCASGRKAPAKG